MRTQLTVLLAVLLAVSAIGPAAVTAGAATGTTVQESAAQCEYPLTISDATGENVTIESEPQSVVTLYPGDAQLAYSIGAEGKVVGMPVSKYTESLEAGDRTDITTDDGVTPVAEKIVSLNPDVVLAANIAMYNQDLLDTLENAGITVVVLDTANSFDDVRENVRVTGEVMGHCAGAEETIQWMNERLEVFENALENESKPLAYYASGPGGSTFGSKTFQHDVLTTAGLTNLAASTGQTSWVQMNTEVIVNEDPKWIIYPDKEQWTSPPMADSLQATTAMQEGNTVAVNDNAMSQPGPNVVYAIEEIVKQVHPEVYAEIEADLEAVDETYSDEGNSTSNESADDSSTENAIPGFSVPAATVALLAATGFVARRR
ncbi:PGF-CTERM-anchored ABC transporter substrate-binding protein [Natrinema sp. 74]|uniref:PGF-CTERM-anchored ABC transporter substrate-binding protein n=1 Tax=Natrinema sp. 74 TaxID=3384159 RepID=UPI0038D3EE7E